MNKFKEKYNFLKQVYINYGDLDSILGEDILEDITLIQLIEELDGKYRASMSELKAIKLLDEVNSYFNERAVGLRFDKYPGDSWKRAKACPSSVKDFNDQYLQKPATIEVGDTVQLKFSKKEFYLRSVEFDESTNQSYYIVTDKNTGENHSVLSSDIETFWR